MRQLLKFVNCVFAMVMMSVLGELHLNTHLNTFQRYTLVVFSHNQLDFFFAFFFLLNFSSTSFNFKIEALCDS